MFRLYPRYAGATGLMPRLEATESAADLEDAVEQRPENQMWDSCLSKGIGKLQETETPYQEIGA